MNTKKMDGRLFAGMIMQGSVNLKTNKSIVNDLNVFPIPDGDTGDNMYMTLSSGCTAATKESGTSLQKVSSKAAEGMLFGARGNSGVILSRIFSGIAKGFEGVDEADISALAKAFDTGVAQSYSAVTNPVEGTILTVFREATTAANEKINGDSTLESYFEDFTKEVKASLERTPDLLDVLKEAGVVDSGGAGLLYIAEGMKAFLNGEKITASDGDDTEKAGTAEAPTDLSLFGPDSELEFGYCTEFLLRLQNKKTDIENFDLEGFIAYLNDIGNSVVAFRDGSIVKVHVHTFNPGTVLDHCRQFGEFLTVKIENMTLQHHNSTVQNRYNGEAETKAETKEQDYGFLKREVRKKYGIIAVAAGEGIKSMFSEICVDKVVDGGQSMNPSAADLIEAIKEVKAETIFILPNNGNIILTAKQAAQLYTDADVRVIETHTIGDGYAVVSMMDLSADTPEEIEEAAKEAMEGVVTGGISVATRTTELNGVNVNEGDYIGFVGNTILSSGTDKKDVCVTLAEKAGADTKDVLLFIRGRNSTEDESDELVASLSESFPELEIIPIDGKQPVFDYMLIFE